VIRLSVRARILSIALIPTVTLLAVGVGASTYLAVEAFQLRDEVANLNTATAPSMEFAVALREERRLSLLLLSGDQSARQSLAEARERVDTVSSSPDLLGAEETIAKIAPETFGTEETSAEATLKAFTQVRQGVDVGLIPADQALLFYNTILDRILLATRAVANAMPYADAVANGGTAVELADAAESMSRSNALAVAVADKITPEQVRTYAEQVGSYRSRLTNITPALTGELRGRATALVNSESWKTLATMENAIIDRGVPAEDSPPLPVSVADWQAAAETVSRDLLSLYDDQYTSVIDGALEQSEQTATWWLVAAGAMLAGALVVGLISLRISARLIRRLKRLRAESLSMANEHLPRIMARLRNGEDVDVNTDLAPLDFGTDEIGDVADAFNRAESAAVSAAVEEAKTRGGINALFLNIAHRSQVVVHRQLELLDRAEHAEEDPDRLAVLFELDHLSTRARRNAENLIILGGEQPGRQWRNPVPLVDLVRSAVAETEDYARVHSGQIANVAIVGNVVADLIHLIAELVENATSYSPPESRVDVTSNVVGRGAVVEITDQGLGMTREQITAANDILREPPAFSVANLSSDSRMGLLVVSRIAARNGVTVKLSESDYGGIRAIVLIPTTLIVAEDTRRPVGVGAGSGAAEANGVATRATVAMGTEISAVPWPTMEPGEPTPSPYPERVIPRRDPVNAPPMENPVTAAEPGVQPTAGRPALPRRRRQNSLAPELANAPQQPPSPQQRSGRHERSSEQARDLFSEIESGTRRGRLARPEPGTNFHHRREGQ
jgi:HAMP domain-containing protein